jgi:hypothetical protein
MRSSGSVRRSKRLQGVGHRLSHSSQVAGMKRRIRKSLTEIGRKFEDFSISFCLTNVSETKHFVAREPELIEIHRTLSGDGSRHIIVLDGL